MRTPSGFVVVASLVLAGCEQATQPLGVDETAIADEKTQILFSVQSGDKVVPPIVHNTPITYEGALFDGDAVLNSVAFRSISIPVLWDYWAFCGLAGDVAVIEVHRTTSQMDPAAALYFGATDDSDGLLPFGGGGPNLAFVAGADDNNFIPHAVGGRFADPRIVATLPFDGFYTITVFDFLGIAPVTGGPAPYELHIKGISSCSAEIPEFPEIPKYPDFPKFPEFPVLPEFAEFAEFVIEEAELELDDDGEWEEDEFEVEGHFVLGDDSDGIDVLNEDVTVVFGTFSHTIPAGSFVRDDDDEGFEFDGTLPDGARLKVDIDDDGEFEVEGEDLDLSGNDPDGSVSISLQIGDDVGETTITLNAGEFEVDDG